jgi:hypothetical protein
MFNKGHHGFSHHAFCFIFASGHSVEMGFRKFLGSPVPLVTIIVAFEA